jgi:hypothetical protein
MKVISLKKAAMFGLDARIALAIFGALSVISGAALYSAIQNAKMVSLYNEFKETTKAWEQYYLDVGSTITLDVTGYYRLTDLINKPSGVVNWNGPYLSNEIIFSGLKSNIDKDLRYDLLIMNSENWSSTSSPTLCKISESCYLWLRIATNTTIENVLDFEEFTDSTRSVLDSDKGDVRWINSSGDNYYIYIKMGAINNPNKWS